MTTNKELELNSSYLAEMETQPGDWTHNALRFATRKEAESYGQDLAMRWTQVRDWRITPSDDPVNYRWDGERGAVNLESDAQEAV